MTILDLDSFNEFANGGIAIGRGISKCADQHPAFVSYYTFAAQAIRKRALSILQSYTTTLEEDMTLLRCAGVEGDDDEFPAQKETCPWTTETLSDRMKTIIRFRMLKKRLLARLAYRLNKDCDISSLNAQG